MRNIVLILICLSTLSSRKLQAQQIYFQHYSVDDGLTSSTIYDVHQDSEGFIWLGTEAGVSRFDGMRFTNFSKQEGLGDNEVFQIFEDKENRVWFFPFNGRLSYYLHGKIHSEQSDKRLRATRIEGIFNKAFQDEYGNLWFGTQKNGVVLINDSYTGIIPFRPGTKSYSIEITGYNGADTLYAKSASTNLVLLLKKENGNYTIRTISETTPLETRPESPPQTIRIYLSQQSEKKWYYTADGRTIEQDGVQLTTMLEGPNLSDVLEDAEHNFWFATLGQGLYMRSALQSFFYDSKSGLAHDEVMSVFPLDDGVLVGMQDGKVDVIENELVEEILLSTTPYNRILHILEDKEQFLFVTDAGFFTYLKENKELRHARIGASKCAVASDSNYFVGTYNGLLKIEKDDLNETKRLWNKRTTALCFDNNAKLWIGTNDGLYCLSNNSIISHTLENPVLEARIRSMVPIGDGLLLGTHGEGLIYYTEDTVLRITQKDGLSSNITHHLFKESENVVWMASNFGLNRIRLDFSKGLSHVIDIFDHENTLVSNYINQVKVRSGKVWAATDRGLSVFSQQSDKKEKQPPIYLTKMKINDRDTVASSGYSLDYDQNKITFVFSGIALRSGANTKFKYRLKGTKDDWEISTSNEVRYQSLKPGKYTFQVLTVTSSGLESEKPAEVYFVIQKPVWKRWWFILSAILLGLIVVALSVRAIIKYNKRKDLEEKNRLIAEEKKRSDELLLNILPEETAEELKRYGKASAKSHKEVTVFFSDFKGFTTIAETMSPEGLVEELDTCFRAFDAIVDKHNLEKIKTIGDAYMCAGGLSKGTASAAKAVVAAALDIQDFMNSYKLKRKEEGRPYFEARIGIHTGSVVAGVVGTHKFAFDIWGDTVNTAARIESSGEVGRINISATTYEKIKEEYDCIHRGKIQAKNKGEIEMYFVRRSK